nr:hypothetical protein [Fournierella massiliensis]
MTPDFAAQFLSVYNVMPVIHLDKNTQAACSLLRNARIPYSVSCLYSAENIKAITNGELFAAVQNLHPLFTVLIPRSDCQHDTQRAAYQAAIDARNRQQFQTIPWELYGDTQSLDSIISDDSCCALFDKDGNLHIPGSPETDVWCCNLFEDGLAGIFSKAYPKALPSRK